MNETEDILKMIMAQEGCSPIYALFLLCRISDGIESEGKNGVRAL